jgi:hypothetical protein
MAFAIIADVFAHAQASPDLTSADVLVLLALANYADRDGHNARPSLQTLARTTKLSRRLLQYRLRALEQKGLVRTCAVQPGRAGYRAYAVCLPRPTEKDATSAPCGSEKGAPRAPFSQEKGAPPAPIPPEKGARDDTEKAQPLHPDPVRDPEDLSPEMHKTRVTKWLREDTQAGRDAALGYQLLARRHGVPALQTARHWGSIDSRVRAWEGGAATDPPGLPAAGRERPRGEERVRMASHPGAV